MSRGTLPDHCEAREGSSAETNTLSKKLARLQQKVSTAKKGSRARKLLVRKVAKLHQKIAQQRKHFTAK